jgi:D-lactate dehydrogenase (quinone)
VTADRPHPAGPGVASESAIGVGPDSTGPPRQPFIPALEAIVGPVLTDARATKPYRTGFRGGSGAAVAVVHPKTLVEFWRVLEACVTANQAVVIQAANTGLTGGSTPHGHDRDVVIINTLRMSRIFAIDQGRQVICLPGATLHELEAYLVPYNREPHSVIGSSCLGSTVIGGICNSSGGALLRRGPAYTQMALFAQVDETGQLQLINHLGVNLGNHDPEAMLGRLEHGDFAMEPTALHASDPDYFREVRDINANTPARFNANPRQLFEASGSAGKIAIFAVRLDTFPKDERTRVFYVGTRNPDELTMLRRHMLSQFTHLPISAEYLHRDLFDVAARYGKDTVRAIQWLGRRRLPTFFKWKRYADALMGSRRIEWLLQQLGRGFPSHLPVRLRQFRDQYEHHLILKVAQQGGTEASAYLSATFPSSTGGYFECTEDEARKAFLHRFVAAGAALRYATLHGRELLSLDIALRRNDRHWFEALPNDARAQIDKALYYGHFFCHVFHQDYIVRQGANVDALKQRLLALLDTRGAEYPAEHNVGHLYRAKPALARFYRSLDPCDCFNPGVGTTIP